MKDTKQKDTMRERAKQKIKKRRNKVRSKDLRTEIE